MLLIIVSSVGTWSFLRNITCSVLFCDNKEYISELCLLRLNNNMINFLKQLSIEVTWNDDLSQLGEYVDELSTR